MTFNFIDRVEAARAPKRPRFKIFRTKLVMNGDARRTYFADTDRVLLAYDAAEQSLAIKALPPDVYEHEGWLAFRIEPQTGANDSYEIKWRQFWDREVGLAGGRPAVVGEESLRRIGEDVIALRL